MKRSCVWSAAFTPLQFPHDAQSSNTKKCSTLKRRKRRAPDRSRSPKDSR
jgi:hypothetical protein